MYNNMPSSPDDHHHHLQKKKRVGKACDSCRIKKTKCDGKKPCNKCIQDNKICVFTEKKKIKDKHYPNGYVELLETRLDLLTKSFEKMIQLSKPHLTFLNDLVEEAPAEMEGADYYIPINKVITYLIHNEQLLKNVPLEWENGALIAANFDRSNIEKDSKKFEIHEQESNDISDTPEIKDVQVKEEFQDFDELDGNMDEFLPNFSRGFVLANSAALTDGLSNDISDFESDSNSIYSQSHPPAQLNNDFDLSFQTPSLFSDSEFFNTHDNSVNSLTHKFENNKLTSPSNHSPPTTLDSSTSLAQRPELLKRSSSLVGTSKSLSHQKLKSLGHIHKPLHHHHNFNLNLSNSNLASNQTKGPGIESELTLPSDSVKLSDINYEDNLLEDL